MYDIIVIWAGASGLFFASQLDSTHNVLILEKSEDIGQKLLMSGGERCNFSNINVSPEHYVGNKKEALYSMFWKFSFQEMTDFLENNSIKTIVEPNGRCILKWGKSKELVDFLKQQIYKKDSTILTKHEVLSVKKEGDTFIVTTDKGEFESKHIILATGGKTYPQTGASDIWWVIAHSFGHTVSPLQQALCGIETSVDVSKLSGSSCEAEITILDGEKEIFRTTGPLLFTHRGFSGPCIFNATVALWDARKKNQDKPFSEYSLKINISPNTVSKRIKELFGEKTSELNFPITKLRPRSEAKVTIWGISITECSPFLESKKCPGLFILWELIDITGETWGFNLQRCRTSAHQCVSYFNKKVLK